MRKSWFLFSSCIVLSIIAIMLLAFGINQMRQETALVMQDHENIKNDDSQPTLYEKKQDLNIMIENYFLENDLDSSEVAICYENLITNEVYEWNPKESFTAASVYKVPLAMLYYEKLANEEIQLDTKLLYTAYSYEEGGGIGETYAPGTYFSLDTLLYESIINSDNTASRILFNHLGGWNEFRSMIKKYDEENAKGEDFLDNVFNVRYTNTVLKHLYENETLYAPLLTNMKLACENEYLKKNVDATIAMKYGSYDMAENAIGIVYGNIPYTISVFTCSSKGEGENIVSDISQICYEYTYAKEK